MENGGDDHDVYFKYGIGHVLVSEGGHRGHVLINCTLLTRVQTPI